MALIKINSNPSRRDLRLFAGLWLPLFSLLVGCQLWHNTHSLRAPIVLWGVSALVAVVSLLSVTVARVIYVGLSYVTFPLGWLVSHVILGAVYYAALTPIGLILRLVGYDTMHRRLDRGAASYWIPRNEPRSDERYFRQY